MNLFWELLEAVIKWYDRFSGIKFWSSERNNENMSHLYFNEESDYTWKNMENTCEDEVFCSTIESVAVT